MPKRGETKAKAPLPNADDPESMASWVWRFLQWLQVKNYSERTIKNRLSYLGFFVTWADARGLVYPHEVTRPALEAHQRHLFRMRMANGRPLSFRSQRCRLVPVRALFAWLTRSNVLLANPASELSLPKMEKRLPRAVLTAEEAERVIAVPEIDEPVGLRDRAILEVFYGRDAEYPFTQHARPVRWVATEFRCGPGTRVRPSVRSLTGRAGGGFPRHVPQSRTRWAPSSGG